MRKPWLLTLLALAACVPDAHLVACLDRCPVTCAGGPCKPRTLARDLGATEPVGLSPDGQVAWVCDRAAKHHLLAASLVPGVRTPDLPLAAGCSGMAVDPSGPYLIWSVATADRPDIAPGVYRTAPGSVEAKVELLASIGESYDVKVERGALLFTAASLPEGGKLYRAALDGSGALPVPGHAGTGAPGAIALGPDGRVFVAWPTNWDISASRDDLGADAVVLVNETPEPAGELAPLALAANGTHLYFGMAGELRRVPVDGSGPFETVATGQGQVTGVLVRGAWVYWLSQRQGALLRVPAGGGEAMVVLSGLASPVALAGSDRELLWIDAGGEGQPVRGMEFPDE